MGVNLYVIYPLDVGYVHDFYMDKGRYKIEQHCL